MSSAFSIFEDDDREENDPLVYLGDGVPRWEWELGDAGDGA